MLRFFTLVLGLLSGLTAGRHVQKEEELPRTDRVVGGTDVPDGSVRWVASLQYRSTHSHFCGGTVINDYWVLTAAHCMIHTEKDSFEIVTGGTDLDATGLTVRLPDKVVTADYDDYEKSNDLSLIRAATPLVPSTRTTGDVMRLAAAAPAPGAVCAVLGWGLTENGGQTVKRLQMAPLQIKSLEECREAYSGTYNIYESMTCAGGNTKDACQGDSGGPLVCRADGGSTGTERLDTAADLLLVGAVSWGIRCATPGKPGVYANVPHMLDWVKDTLAAEQ